jgi:Arm DNA-binding domain
MGRFGPSTWKDLAIPRTYRRLTIADVDKLKAARSSGMYPDGDGLYFAISKAGVPSWIYRFMIAGRARGMGLGPVRDVKLSQARQLAYEARQRKRQGCDPIAERQAKSQGAAVKKDQDIS